MSAELIDGKKMALEIRQSLARQVAELQIKPKLAVILVGHDEASLVYVKNKQKAATEIGMECALYTFDESVGQTQIEQLIENLNKDKSVNGILVQLPLPKGFDEKKLLEKTGERLPLRCFARFPKPFITEHILRTGLPSTVLSLPLPAPLRSRTAIYPATPRFFRAGTR